MFRADLQLRIVSRMKPHRLWDRNSGKKSAIFFSQDRETLQRCVQTEGVRV